ncbi:MAG: homoserine dehydrogenase, partial [Clostridia bacterium]|nr:homoserine dehydrogenase [Clostridia bacterium]
ATASMIGGKLEYEVKPTLIPFSHPLAGVSNEFNAIFIKGNAVDELMFYGKGAGPLPTGSAIMGDIIQIGKSIIKHSAYDIVVPGSNKYL